MEEKDVEDIDGRLKKIEEACAMLPEIKLLLSNISTAQSVMAQSSKSMAETYDKAERRQEEQRLEYSALVALAVGKNQVPLETHRASMKAAILSGVVPTGIISFCIVVGVLYWTGTSMNASLTNIQLNQAAAQRKIETVEKKVSEVASDVDHKTKGPEPH